MLTMMILRMENADNDDLEDGKWKEDADRGWLGRIASIGGSVGETPYITPTRAPCALM